MEDGPVDCARVDEDGDGYGDALECESVQFELRGRFGVVVGGDLRYLRPDGLDRKSVV